MIENWKKSLGKNVFDTINYQLLISKLNAYGFDKNALEINWNYLTNRWQRTKIN